MKQPTAPGVEQIYPSLTSELIQAQDQGNLGLPNRGQAGDLPTQQDPSNFRLFEIRKLEGRLETERDLREKLYKKYRRAINVVDGVDTVLVVASIGLGATGVGLLSTIIAAPVVVILEGAALCCGIAGVAGKFISRKLLLKAKKHDDIRVLATSKLNSISDLVSKAIQDQHISPEEYSLILAEWKKYLQMKKDIRSPHQQTQSTQNSNASKNELMAQAREQIMKELASAASK